MQYTESIHNLLLENKLFDSLSDDEVKRIFEIMDDKHFKPGEVIVTEGEPPDDIYIILEGEASVFKTLQEENEVTEQELAILKEKDTIGEVALIDAQPRSATVRAIKDVHAIAFSMSDLAKLSDREDSIDAKLKINFAKKLSDYLRNTNVNTLSERKKHKTEIVQLTNFDIVTGLPNQHLFKETIEKAINVSSHEPFAIIQIELIDYKEICDAIGEEIGERLLTVISDRLSSCLTDISMLARVGFNQFMILQEEISDPEALSVLASRIVRLFSTPFNVGDDNIFTSVYVGVARCPDDGEDAATLIKHAGLALDAAKLDEPNSFAFYSADMNELVARRRRLVHDLHKAYENDEFELFYQPQIDVKTNQIIGAETLIRWFHPEQGMISPAEFIPIVEQTGLIVKLGNWILKMACAQTKMWTEAGMSPLRIAVNLSAIQFKQKDLIEIIKNAIEETNIDPSLIELEITEGVMMSDIDETVKKIQELVDMGFQIAIDDFGTGYSSLSYLRRLPIHKLKIDQSFVKDLHNSEDSKDIIRCIIGMAKGLRLDVIAEGIEDDEQLQFLNQLGCDEGQGYYFSKPVSASEFEKIYAKHNQEKASG